MTDFRLKLSPALPALKLQISTPRMVARTLPYFPGVVVAGSGILLNQVGVTYTISADVAAIAASLPSALTFTGKTVTGGTFTGLVSVSIATGAVVASTPGLQLTQTWNNGAVAFTAALINITATAFANGSSWVDYQEGGTSRIKASLNSAGEPIVQLFGATTKRPRLQVGLDTDATARINFGLSAGDLPTFGFGPGGAGARDTFMVRNAQGVFSLSQSDDGVTGGATWRSVANTPPTLASGTTNDYAPGGTSYFQRWTANAANSVVTSYSVNSGGQLDGEVHVVVNLGTGTLTLTHAGGTGTASNRFLNTTGADIVLSQNQMADVIYDGATARWRVSKRN